MRVLGLVPARGGSVGVPRKNIRTVAGKPLLAWTAEAALAARALDRVVLSTDDREIAAVGRGVGLEVPFLRPAELARADTPSLPVVQHALRFLAERGELFDAVCLLQPTSPLRLPEDIDGAVDLLERSGADSVISLAEAPEHPARMKLVSSDGRVVDPPWLDEDEWKPRQALPKVWVRDGSIYLTRTRVLLEEGSFQGRDCRAWIVPSERAVNVDTELDLRLAELMLREAPVRGAA